MELLVIIITLALIFDYINGGVKGGSLLRSDERCEATFFSRFGGYGRHFLILLHSLLLNV